MFFDAEGIFSIYTSSLQQFAKVCFSQVALVAVS